MPRYIATAARYIGTAGVGVFVAEKWIEKVFEVKRVSDRIILVKIIDGQRVLCLLSVYAPQCGLSDSVKDLFYDQPRAVTAMIPASEFLIPCGDWNGHVGSTGSGYKEVLLTGPRSAVGNMSGYRCVSDCNSKGHEFDPGPVPYFRGD